MLSDDLVHTLCNGQCFTDELPIAKNKYFFEPPDENGHLLTGKAAYCCKKVSGTCLNVLQMKVEKYLGKRCKLCVQLPG